jgi:hypothetical protein
LGNAAPARSLETAQGQRVHDRIGRFAFFGKLYGDGR